MNNIKQYLLIVSCLQGMQLHAADFRQNESSNEYEQLRQEGERITYNGNNTTEPMQEQKQEVPAVPALPEIPFIKNNATKNPSIHNPYEKQQRQKRNEITDKKCKQCEADLYDYVKIRAESIESSLDQYGQLLDKEKNVIDPAILKECEIYIKSAELLGRVAQKFEVDKQKRVADLLTHYKKLRENNAAYEDADVDSLLSNVQDNAVYLLSANLQQITTALYRDQQVSSNVEVAHKLRMTEVVKPLLNKISGEVDKVHFSLNKYIEQITNQYFGGDVQALLKKWEAHEFKENSGFNHIINIWIMQEEWRGKNQQEIEVLNVQKQQFEADAKKKSSEWQFDQVVPSGLGGLTIGGVSVAAFLWLTGRITTQ